MKSATGWSLVYLDKSAKFLAYADSAAGKTLGIPIVFKPPSKVAFS
jgi:hypothetical protein